MIEVDGLDGLNQQAAELEKNLGAPRRSWGLQRGARADAYESMTYTGREVTSLSNSIGRGCAAPSTGWCSTA